MICMSGVLVVQAARPSLDNANTIDYDQRGLKIFCRTSWTVTLTNAL